MNEIKKEPLCDQVRFAIACGDCITNSYLEHLKTCDECRRFYAEQNELCEILNKTQIPGIVEGTIADAVMQTVNAQNYTRSVKTKRVCWRNYIGTAAAAVIILVAFASSKLWPVLDVDNSVSKERLSVQDQAGDTSSIADLTTQITTFDQSQSANGGGGGSSAGSQAKFMASAPENATEQESMQNNEAYLLSDEADDFDVLIDHVKQTPFHKALFDLSGTLSQNINIANRIAEQNYSFSALIDANDQRLKNVSSTQFIEWATSLDSYEQYNINFFIEYLVK